MIENLSELAGLLEEEAVLHEELLSIVMKEREILRAFATEELYENNKAKENLILKIRLMEEARQNLINRMDTGGELGEELTLLRIAELSPSPWKETLLELRSRLSALMEEIMSLNQSNRALVKYAQNNLNHLLSLFSFYGKKDSIYNQTGRAERVSGSGLMISQNI